MKCPYCGYENEEFNIKCKNCDASLSEISEKLEKEEENRKGGLALLIGGLIFLLF